MVICNVSVPWLMAMESQFTRNFMPNIYLKVYHTNGGNNLQGIRFQYAYSWSMDTKERKKPITWKEEKRKLFGKTEWSLSCFPLFFCGVHVEIYKSTIFGP